MGKVIGFELNSQEVEKAVKFYTNVFGRKISESKWDYCSISTNDNKERTGIDSGISKGPNDYPHGTRMQIEVGSIDATISWVKENGAIVVREKMEYEHFF